MTEVHFVINGHLCKVQSSDQYSAVMTLKISDSPVQIYFSKDEHPELKQRIMKNLLDACDQRRTQSVSISS